MLGALLAFPAGAVATEGTADAIPTAVPPSPSIPDPAAARQYLAAIRPSADLQGFLDRTVEEIGRGDARFLASTPRVAVIDLTSPSAPQIAQVRGELPVYPASVIKFVYLMAAYAWQEQGRLRIDATLDADLTAMIHESSNQATQKVFARLTGTEPGAELEPKQYAEFRERRLMVERWLETMGVDDLHAVNPTYDGDGDLFGRDQQFLRDRSVPGGLAVQGNQYSNRTAMTAAGSARLLALLATDRALTAADSATVRQRMRRDVREQPHLLHRIAGGTLGIAGTVVYAKSGTWGPIYADAGIVRDSGGRQFTIAVFTDANPPYRGDAIAQITRRVASHLFVGPPVGQGGSS
jgi:beta-lactamase class A